MKFVLQHHTNGTDHFDLMIESEKSMLTWQISTNDMKYLLKGKQISAARIKDHRKEYITYEGPISGNRGEVKILDSGLCYILTMNKDITEVRFYGKLINGILFLEYYKNNVYYAVLSRDDYSDSNKSGE